MSRSQCNPIPTTETRNPATMAIDTVSTLELVRIINAQDVAVATAVGDLTIAVVVGPR